MKTTGETIGLVIDIFLLFMLVRFVVDCIQLFARSWHPRGPVLMILEVVFSVTDPPINAMRRVIPPLRLGGAAIDMGFISVILICYVLQYVNGAIFY
ncbi:MAG: hypothetical protein JWR35_2323 [Marmoricola sp.]|jgi:YggT family protein|nr:hypothetical protein [Marmoricola sp.]